MAIFFLSDNAGSSSSGDNIWASLPDSDAKNVIFHYQQQSNNALYIIFFFAAQEERNEMLSKTFGANAFIEHFGCSVGFATSIKKNDSHEFVFFVLFCFVLLHTIIFQYIEKRISHSLEHRPRKRKKDKK